MNLSEFVEHPFTDKSYFDYECFEDAVKHSVIGLNEVLHEGLPLHPLKEQQECVNNWRQIGLGIFGWHDALLKMGIRYGSETSLTLAEEIGNKLLNRAVQTSAELTEKHGKYPMYDEDAIFKSDFFNTNITPYVKEIVKEKGLANSQLLTIAPTGSLGTMLDVSTGVEPLFTFSYTRKTESLHGEDKYYKVYPKIVKEYMNAKNITDEKDLPEYFNNAMNLNYKERINMQSAWQKNIDASISSTVNVPADFTVEEVADLYMYAWKRHLKGVTIYRDNCARTGILTTKDEEQDTKQADNSQEIKFDSIAPIRRGALGKTYGVTVDKKSACGKMFITINRDKHGNIVESFVNVGQAGICGSNIAGINRLLSLALRSGVNVEEIIDQLKGTICPACTRKGVKGIDGLSCPDIIGRVLQEEYKQTKNLKNEKIKDLPIAKQEDKPINKEDLSNLPVKKNLCPSCKESLQNSGGCRSCTNCGWTKCD